MAWDEDYRSAWDEDFYDVVLEEMRRESEQDWAERWTTAWDRLE